ncbi:MAG: Maf family protein, partial [Anaerotignum sp.]|nr:Maf family protein [Anaerotignum sp.]
MKLILASASPRRKELLAKTGLAFDIIPAKGEETITKTIPAEVVMELSQQKA